MILVDRRKLLPPVIFVIILLILLIIRSPLFNKSQNIDDISGSDVFTIKGPAMGTSYTVSIKANNDSINFDIIKKDIELILLNINDQMSTYQIDSEISKFNSSDDFQKIAEFTISEDFANVINKSFYYNDLSGKVFDITIYPLYNLWGFQNKTDSANSPSKSAIDSTLKFVGMDKFQIKKNKLIKKTSNVSIDVSAIAKGYTVDLIYDYLSQKGFENYYIDIGGETRVRSAISKTGWPIGIAVPDLAYLGEVMQVINLKNNSIATSGNYANFIDYLNLDYDMTHIINPITGYPLEIKNGVVSSASVIAPLCVDADALATILMILSKDDGLKLIESIDSVEAYIIYLEEGTLKTVQSSGFGFYLD